MFAVTSHDETPLYLAVQQRKMKCVDAFLKYVSDKNKLLLARASINLFYKDCSRMYREATPLHVAVSCCEKETSGAQQLLQTPVFKEIDDKHEVYTGIEIIKTLLSHASDKELLLSARTADGETPLHLAVRIGNGEAIRVLLSCIDEPNKLLMVCNNAGKNSLQLLLEIRDDYSTPLEEIIELYGLEAAQEIEALLSPTAAGDVMMVQPLSSSSNERQGVKRDSITLSLNDEVKRKKGDDDD